MILLVVIVISKSKSYEYMYISGVKYLIINAEDHISNAADDSSADKYREHDTRVAIQINRK